MASWLQIEFSANTEMDNFIKEKMTLFLKVFSLISTFMSKETKAYTFQIIVQPYRELVREGNGNPLQYSCLENPHRQRSLAGYSPWGHRVVHDWSNLISMHAYKEPRNSAQKA